MQRVLQIELNEVNFEYLERYAARGDLPAFAEFLDKYGYTVTDSERNQEHLEPWIQWVTAHTGKSFSEHGVFRLGDIVGTGIPQIWERLEKRGFRVGAMSPMNAECRVSNPAFFVPDPWTPTEVKADTSTVRLHGAIAQAVNDNAEARITPRSALELALASLKAVRPSTVSQYGNLIVNAVKRPWFKAMYLDLLLADLFTMQVGKTKPDFASLFLNAAAHIQHHYMFSSPLYDGPFRNPEWYVAPSEDPVLDVYRLYDGILARLMRRFPTARIMLVTGLHQDPYPELTFYWRLKEHEAFLRRIGVPFQMVQPRMSRDFLVKCASVEEAGRAAARLGLAVADGGVPLFSVDNRGDDLFVELIYPHDIKPECNFRVGNEPILDFRSDVSFVAIKNGGHNGAGYFADSGMRLSKQDHFPLKELAARVEAAVAGPI